MGRAGQSSSVPEPAPFGSNGVAGMPRQRINYFRDTYVFPQDFPQRLVRFKEESDLPWAEIARCLGTYPHTVWRWKEGLGRPNAQHMMALLKLADDHGLGHLFTD